VGDAASKSRHPPPTTAKEGVVVAASVDSAGFALSPLIDLTADPDVPPSLLGAAALHWSATSDAVGWSAGRVPPRELFTLLRSSGLLTDDPLSALWKDFAEPARLLWTARLAIQLGRFDHAREIARQIGDDATADERGWRDLVLALAAGVAPPPLPAGSSPALRLAHAVHALDHAGEPVASLIAEADLAAAEVAATDAALGAVARARVLARHVSSQQDEAERLLAEHDATDDFLWREAAHELRLAVARHALARGDLTAAGRHVDAALLLDPTGAPTHLLAARVAAVATDHATARRHYRAAARHGLVERGPALAGLLDLAGVEGHDPADDPSLVGAVADLLTLDPASEPTRLAVLADRRTVLLNTVAEDTVRWALTDPAPDSGRRRPLPLERYRPFLDLREPVGLAQRDLPPVAIHTPLMSLAAVVERRAPWFREIHPQRATAAMFRTELAGAARVHGYPSGGASADYRTWRDAPDGCPADLRETLTHAGELPMLDRALTSRLLSALGFYPTAKAILPGPDASVTDPESAYALASWLFAEQMHTTGSDGDLEPLFQRLYDQLGADIRYARLRVVTTINATVNAARRRAPETIARWRAEGERAMADYTALAEVDEFSAALMTSRWYRAMGFLPFLTGDRELLVADMDRWLGIAGDLVGHDAHTRIIAADNYFPAVETAIRTHTHLGNTELALRLVEKLAAEIDPVDPKTWLTAGELRYQAGDVRGALLAYQRAAHLEFPYGRLSWFNAGQCHEQLGGVDEAVECYRRSLAYWPTGLTPVRRLRDLLASGAIKDDGGVVAAWTARQPAWPTLTPLSS
jgi:tetratricopeptide (TPR) repeat protein